MSLKDEIRAAKALARELKEGGEEVAEIALRLNREFEGFYYKAAERVFMDNTPDYALPVRIL